MRAFQSPGADPAETRPGEILATAPIVVCRIHVSRGPEGCTIHVAGRLAGPHVDDLLEVCAGTSGRLRIDLTDLLSVDRTSVEALQHLANTGAELVGVPQYLGFELKSLP